MCISVLLLAYLPAARVLCDKHIACFHQKRSINDSSCAFSRNLAVRCSGFKAQETFFIFNHLPSPQAQRSAPPDTERRWAHPCKAYVVFAMTGGALKYQTSTQSRFRQIKTHQKNCINVLVGKTWEPSQGTQGDQSRCPQACKVPPFWKLSCYKALRLLVCWCWRVWFSLGSFFR